MGKTQRWVKHENLKIQNGNFLAKLKKNTSSHAFVYENIFLFLYLL